VGKNKENKGVRSLLYCSIVEVLFDYGAEGVDAAIATAVERAVNGSDVIDIRIRNRRPEHTLVGNRADAEFINRGIDGGVEPCFVWG